MTALREKFPPELFAAAYPLIEDLELKRVGPAQVRATVGAEHEVEMTRGESTCTCSAAEGYQWMRRHKLAVLLRHRIDDGSLDAEEVDDEHLRTLSQMRSRVPWHDVHAYLDTIARDDVVDIALQASFESSGFGWPLQAAAARWSMDLLGFADHLYAVVEDSLSAKASVEVMPKVPEQLRTVTSVLMRTIDQGAAMQTLPAVTLLLHRMRTVIEASMPVAAEVRRFFSECTELLESLVPQGALTWRECAELLLDLEIEERDPDSLCPSLQWYTPSRELNDALRAGLRERLEETFEKLMAFSDIYVDMDVALSRRWNRLMRVRAEVAFASDDLEELAQVLVRWGAAPYGEFVRRGVNRHPKNGVLPLSETAMRVGRVTQLDWILKLRTSVTEVEEGQKFSGMRGGIPVDSRRTSPLRDVSHSILVGGLLEVGRNDDALGALRELFAPCPDPEAIPALQTWWARTGTGEDVIAFTRSVMLGESFSQDSEQLTSTRP